MVKTPYTSRFVQMPYLGGATNTLYLPVELSTMKKQALFLILASGILSASAQTNKSASDTIAKVDIGTTVYGLPVHKSYVPADAAERAKKKYGRALYSIEKTTAADCQNSYLVGLIRNGRLTMEWMCDDPKIALLYNSLKEEAFANQIAHLRTK